MLNYQRKDREINYNAISEKQSILLPQTALLRGVLLRVSGIVTLSIADATSLASRAPHSFVESIDVVGNGKEVIKSFSGANLKCLNDYDFGTPLEYTAPGLTQAAHPFSVYYFINFADVASKKKADTYLRTEDYNSVELRVKLGGDLDMFVMGSSVAVWSALKVEVVLREATGLQGPLTINKEHTTTKEITSSSNSFRVELNTGNRIRRIFIIATDDGDPQNDIINNIKIHSGSHVFVDEPGWSTRQKNKVDYKLVALEDGVYMVDFITDGHKTESLPTLGMNNLFLECDVTVGGGTTFLEVIPMELI